MSEKIKTFSFQIQSETPALMAKFTDQKQKVLSAEQVAEKKTYRDEEGHLVLPAINLRRAIIQTFINRVKKNKDAEEWRVSSRIKVQPENMRLGSDEYDIYSRPVAIKKNGRIASKITDHSAIIKNWAVSGEIITTLDIDLDELKQVVAEAGMNEGVFSNRKNGYGRFKVIEFKKCDTAAQQSAAEPSKA